jgi:hypothetical protein
VFMADLQPQQMSPAATPKLRVIFEKSSRTFCAHVCH